jgi:hypothetical protein
MHGDTAAAYAFLDNIIAGGHSVPLAGLDLSHTNLGVKGAVMVASAISSGRVRDELYLGSCSLGDDGVIELAAALQNASVRVLDLESNELTNTGAMALAKAVEKHTGGNAFAEVSIEHNPIGGLGAAALAKTLESRRDIAAGWRFGGGSTGNAASDYGAGWEGSALGGEEKAHFDALFHKHTCSGQCSKDAGACEWPSAALLEAAGLVPPRPTRALLSLVATAATLPAPLLELPPHDAVPATRRLGRRPDAWYAEEKVRLEKLAAAEARVPLLAAPSEEQRRDDMASLRIRMSAAGVCQPPLEACAITHSHGSITPRRLGRRPDAWYAAQAAGTQRPPPVAPQEERFIGDNCSDAFLQFMRDEPIGYVCAAQHFNHHNTTLLLSTSNLLCKQDSYQGSAESGTFWNIRSHASTHASPNNKYARPRSFPDASPNMESFPLFLPGR